MLCVSVTSLCYISLLHLSATSLCYIFLLHLSNISVTSTIWVSCLYHVFYLHPLPLTCIHHIFICFWHFFQLLFAYISIASCFSFSFFFLFFICFFHLYQSLPEHLSVASLDHLLLIFLLFTSRMFLLVSCMSNSCFSHCFQLHLASLSVAYCTVSTFFLLTFRFF
jgi:hypothetical protein